MKKIIFSALAMLLVAGSAQARGFDGFDRTDYEETSDFTVMAFGGMNISNFKGLPSSLGMNPKCGFTIGVRAEYELPQCFGIFVNAGLEYGMKGAREHIEGVASVGATAIARPMYVSLPIHVGYRYNVNEMLGFYADFGPYFALGTNGKYRLKYDDYQADFKANVFRNDDNPNFYDIQRYDFGLGYRIGCEYAGHYNFTLGMDWGITDMLTQNQKHLLYQNNFDFKMRNFNASLTFGYRF